MKTLGKIVLTCSLALGGCSPTAKETAEDRCEAHVPKSYDIVNDSCDKISKPEAANECNRLITLMRESAMSACLTRELDIATSCTETKEGFDCEAKK